MDDATIKSRQCNAALSEKNMQTGGARTGRILKIKTGYNPNSSSIGVDVIAFFTAGAAMTVLFNTVAAVLSAIKAGEGREARRSEGNASTPSLGEAK